MFCLRECGVTLMAAKHTLEDAKQLQLVVDVGLLLLQVNRTYVVLVRLLSGNERN
jgi:hypothetical protein